jgi:hypothetical protein
MAIKVRIGTAPSAHLTAKSGGSLLVLTILILKRLGERHHFAFAVVTRGFCEAVISNASAFRQLASEYVFFDANRLISTSPTRRQARERSKSP